MNTNARRAIVVIVGATLAFLSPQVGAANAATHSASSEVQQINELLVSSGLDEPLQLILNSATLQRAQQDLVASTVTQAATEAVVVSAEEQERALSAALADRSTVTAADALGDEALADAMNELRQNEAYPELMALVAAGAQNGSISISAGFPGIGVIGGAFTAVTAVVTGVKLIAGAVPFYALGVVACGASVVCGVGLGFIGALYVTSIAVGAISVGVVAIQRGAATDAANAPRDIAYARDYAFCLATQACYP